MYNIKKIINNNVVLVVDTKLREYVAFGKGIGFEKKFDDVVTSSEIEKKYSLLQGDDKLLEYIQDIDYNLLKLCDEIKEEAEKYFNTSYTNYMYFGLVDHIDTAIKRYKLDIKIPSNLSVEEEKFYEKEFVLAKRVVDKINNVYKIFLDRDEVSFIALHFITLNYNVEYSQANEKVLKISRDIMNIIRYDEGKEIENDFNVQRFNIHLKYFIIRQINDNKLESNYNDDLYKLLIAQNEESSKVLNKIVDYLETKHGFVVEPDERMYLLIHLVKIIK